MPTALGFLTVMTFIQVVASVAGMSTSLRYVALIQKIVLAVDIALVVNAVTTSPSDEYDGDYNQEPWYPQLGMNGLYLNLAAVRLSAMF